MTATESRTAPPVIAYTIIHQSGRKSDNPAYQETVSLLHAAIEEESRAFNREHQQTIAGLIAQSSLQLRGGLSEFLSMPIRSDSAEVQKIFEDAYTGFLRSAAPQLPRGVIASTEGEILPAPSGISPKPKILTVAPFLQSMGIATTKAAPPVFESVYLVEGAENLDVIEEIIRDRLGVYRSIHGKHIASKPRSAAGLYNKIGETGKTGMEGFGEAVVWFTKPAMTYERFRDQLAQIADALQSGGDVEGTSLWQRKLGLGPGREFILRCLIPQTGHFRKFLAALKSIPGESAVVEALRTEGVCYCKRWSRPSAPKGTS